MNAAQDKRAHNAAGRQSGKNRAALEETENRWLTLAEQVESAESV